MTNDNTIDFRLKISNFDKVKTALQWIGTLRFTASEYAIIIYQLNQQYGHIKDGKIKDGDTASYSLMCKYTGYKRRQVIDSVNSLVRRNILIKESLGYYRTNHYKFNEHFYEWR